MVDRKTMIWAGGVVVVIVAVVVFALPGKEKRIKRQFSRLCSEVNKDEGEGLLGTALRVRRTEALFAPTCTVRVAEVWLDGMQESNALVAQGFQARMQFRSLRLRFSDFNISFAGDDLATCEVVAKLVGTSTGGSGVDEAREMEWKLRKINSEWLFESIKGIEVITK